MGGAVAGRDTNLGYAPFPEEFAFANKPLAVALLEMQMGLGYGTAPAKSAEVLLDRLIEIRKELQTRVQRNGRSATSRPM